MTLDTVLANWREDAAVLRKRGHTHDADLVERLCDDIAAAAEDLLAWLPEEQAALQSGHTVRWLRARFDEWAALGHAKREGRVRKYRAIIVPRRAHAELAYRAGQRAATEGRAA